MSLHPDKAALFSPQILSVRGPLASFRLDKRALVVTLLALAGALALMALMLMLGDYPVSFPELLAVFSGRGEGLAPTVVLEWRMPRALMALVCGAALGLGGAIFQSLTRNPLGSPDIIGFSAGAYTGALIVIILLGGGYIAVVAGALAGGLATALCVYILAYRSGVQGFRLIVVGIAVSAILSSLNIWMLLRSDNEVAMSAAIWGAGSLNSSGWDQAVPASLVFLLLAPFVAAWSGPLKQLELGDDAAAALGLNVERSRLVLIFLGVALTACVTAVAGPISFIALAAPQIARRLSRSAGVSLLPAAAMGGLLLVAADLLAQRLFAPRQWPVGIMTVSVGGLYLLWLLASEARRRG